MIEKENLFELMGNSDSRYHSAILTSYSFDPIFFSNLYLPELKRRGITNVIVLLEASNYDNVMADFGKFGEYLGRRDYSLFRFDTGNHGVFHPKIVFLAGQSQGMLMAGSGNLTFSGHSVNEEVWGAVNLDDKSVVNFPLFSAAWNYLVGLIPADSDVAQQQLSWFREYSPWINELQASAAGAEDEDADIHFLSNAGGRSIFNRVSDFIGDAGVKEIDIISPFYDSNAALLQLLNDRYRPQKMRCWVSPTGTFPQNFKELEFADFYKWKKTETLKESLHAKIFQFTTDRGTYLVVGSANATINAWGINRAIANHEGVLLTHSEKNRNFIKELGIEIRKPESANSLTPPEIEREAKATPLRVKLIRVEMTDDRLTITAEGAHEDDAVGLLDEKGNEIAAFPYAPSLAIDDETRAKARLAVISDESGNVSNRCIILDEDEIAKTNPNPTAKKLSSYIGSSLTWHDNIARILPFISIAPAGPKPGEATSRGKRSQDQAATRELEEGAYREVMLKGKNAILSRPDIIIADFLYKALDTDKSGSEDPSLEGEENLSQEDIDKGANGTGEAIQIDITQRDRTEASHRSVVFFLRKYGEQLGKQHAEFEAGFEVNQDPDLQNFNPNVLDNARRQESESSLDDYSHAFIATALIALELNDGTISKGDAAGYLVKTIGRFLLYYGNRYGNTGDYAYRKKSRLHKDMAVLTLQNIARLEWSDTYGANVDAKLIVLNLLESLPEDVDLAEEIVGKAIGELSANNIRTYPGSLALIEQILQQYLDFRDRRKAGNKGVMESIEPSWDYAYIYKSAVGFAYLDEFRRNPQPETGWRWEYRLFPSGYPQDSFRIRAGEKVLLLE